MPGPQDFPQGGIHEAPPATAVDVDQDLLDGTELDVDDDVDPAQADRAKDDGEPGRYFPPGEQVKG